MMLGRRGDTTFTFGNIIISVVLAGAVIAMLFLLVPYDALDMERFKESAYATDNMLLIESLHITNDATIRVGYLLENPYYAVSLRKHVFAIRNEIRKGAETIRYYGTDRDITITEETFSPRIYEYVKTPTSLSLSLVVSGDACPNLPSIPDYAGNVMVPKGKPIARAALDGGLLHLNPAPFIMDLQLAGSSVRGRHVLTVTTEVARREITVVHGRDPELVRLGCLLAQELGAQGEGRVVITIDDTMLRDDGVGIILPAGTDTPRMMDAMSCAYRRLTAPETPMYCMELEVRPLGR